MKSTQLTRIPEKADEPLVEVLDAGLRPVAVVPMSEARRQFLQHRSVAVLLSDEGGRVYLQRTPGGRGKRLWDVSARGAVLAHEALASAATRILEQATGLHVERMRLAFEQRPCVENGNEYLHVFQCARPVVGTDTLERGQFYTADEVLYLMREFRELVSPRFMLLAEASELFRKPGLRA